MQFSFFVSEQKLIHDDNKTNVCPLASSKQQLIGAVMSTRDKTKQLRLAVSHSTELDDWISARHYLGYCPPGAKLRLWIFSGHTPIGAMMFGRPSARTYDNGTVWELTRFVFIDETPHCIESRALAMARKYIRNYFPKVKGLISYSSTANNHHGVIYKADNWFQLGWTTGGTWDSKTHLNRRNVDTSKKQRWVRSVA